MGEETPGGQKHPRGSCAVLLTTLGHYRYKDRTEAIKNAHGLNMGLSRPMTRSSSFGSRNLDIGGDMQKAGEQAMDCHFDKALSGAGDILVSDLERLLVFLASVAKADVEDAVLLTEVGHFLVLRVAGHLGRENQGSRFTLVCHTMRHDCHMRHL